MNLSRPQSLASRTPKLTTVSALLLCLAVGCSGTRSRIEGLSANSPLPTPSMTLKPSVPAISAPTRAEIESALEPKPLEEVVAADPEISDPNDLGEAVNTYYYFPNEADFEDNTSIPLMGADCKPIAIVRQSFYNALCIQGSGKLTDGDTASFHNRCACGEVCPLTKHRLCFDRLSAKDFRWGRGGMQKPVTPLSTIAADTSLIPYDTVVYIPEFNGLPRGKFGKKPHDGCFRVEDTGLWITGHHIDLFTGNKETMELWEKLVPSKSGVHVYLNSPECAYLSP